MQKKRMGTSQTSGQVCPQNVKDLEEDIKGHTSETVFHQTRTLGKLKENGDENITASINGKQNSSFLVKNEKQAPSDSTIHKSMENGYTPPAISPQLEEVLPVAMFNDREKSLPGKITTEDFPNTVEVLKPAKGKFIREVKCGAFNVHVETTKSIFCKTGAQNLTKRRCPTCHQHYSVQQVWRGSKSRGHFSKHRTVLAEEFKRRVPSTYRRGVSRSEVPSVNISIVGKEIMVEYISKKQNTFINICHPNSIGKLTKHRRGPLKHTTDEPCESASQPGINHPENQRLENQHQSSDAFHDAPCSVNAVQKENSDTIVVSLSSPPRREKEKPNTLPSAPDDSEEGESATSPQKVLQITQDKPLEQHCFTADSCLPTSSETLRTTSLNNVDLSKMSLEDSRDVDEERKNSSDVRENITPDSQVQPCTAGTNGPLSAVNSIIPIQDASGSEFSPLSFLTLQLLGAKADNMGCRGEETLPGEGHESSNSLLFPVSEQAAKPSPLLSPSHRVSRCSEPVETTGNTFSFSQYIGVEREQEKVHYRLINKASLHNDSSSNIQPLERKDPQSPAVTIASCSILVPKSPLHGNIHSSVEWNQTEDHANHAERAGLSRMEVPVMASITNELEQSLATQNYKESTVDSNSPMAIRNPRESTSYLENVGDDASQALPVVKNMCHRNFEDLTRENQNEICSQMDFLQNSSESTSVGHTTEKLFLIDKTLASDDDSNSNRDHKTCGLNNFQQEPAECQRTTSRVYCEESGNQRYPTEVSCHPVDILLSPQKQKALKALKKEEDEEASDSKRTGKDYRFEDI